MDGWRRRAPPAPAPPPPQPHPHSFPFPLMPNSGVVGERSAAGKEGGSEPDCSLPSSARPCLALLSSVSLICSAGPGSTSGPLLSACRRGQDRHGLRPQPLTGGATRGGGKGEQRGIVASEGGERMREFGKKRQRKRERKGLELERIRGD